MTAFSDLLREAKARTGWSNRKIAEAAGVAPATVDTYMRDDHGLPDESTSSRLCMSRAL